MGFSGKYRFATRSMSNGIYQHVMESASPDFIKVTEAIKTHGVTIIPRNISVEVGAC